MRAPQTLPSVAGFLMGKGVGCCAKQNNEGQMTHKKHNLCKSPVLQKMLCRKSGFII